VFYLRRVCKIAKSDCWLRHICLSVSVEKFGCHRKDFRKSCYLCIFRKSVEEIEFSLKSDKNKGQIKFIIISREILLRMKNVSEKSFRENQIRILYSSVFFLIFSFIRQCRQMKYILTGYRRQ
jgi:hypothetical protein